MKLGVVTTVAAVLSCVVLMGSLTFAEAANINQRQRNQQQRIREGVRSGELTRHEVKRLGREQTHIRRDEAWAKSDGVFTPRERARIQQEQNRASADIYRQKHDNQTRY
jgi:uncharacterized membrane protein YebE (DUF533 family)